MYILSLRSATSRASLCELIDIPSSLLTPHLFGLGDHRSCAREEPSPLPLIDGLKLGRRRPLRRHHSSCPHTFEDGHIESHSRIDAARNDSGAICITSGLSGLHTAERRRTSRFTAVMYRLTEADWSPLLEVSRYSFLGLPLRYKGTDNCARRPCSSLVY